MRMVLVLEPEGREAAADRGKRCYLRGFEFDFGREGFPATGEAWAGAVGVAGVVPHQASGITSSARV